MNSEKLIERFVDTNNKACIMNGLMMAQIICQRRFLDAFDQGGTATLSMVMEDIADAMEDIQRAVAEE